jgi:hypothetical protein
MNRSQKRFTKVLGTGAMVLLLTGTVMHQAMPHTHGAAVPMPSGPEFGLGPRLSDGGMYSATLAPERALQVGKMQSVRVVLVDSSGQPVSDARITADGGMPEHGHGLPTSPVVTPSAEAGVYEIQGVKFNMGGWWVFNLHIDAPAGPDTITFNLAL